MSSFLFGDLTPSPTSLPAPWKHVFLMPALVHVPCLDYPLGVPLSSLSSHSSVVLRSWVRSATWLLCLYNRAAECCWRQPSTCVSANITWILGAPSSSQGCPRLLPPFLTFLSLPFLSLVLADDLAFYFTVKIENIKWNLVLFLSSQQTQPSFPLVPVSESKLCTCM